MPPRKRKADQSSSYGYAAQAGPSVYNSYPYSHASGSATSTSHLLAALESVQTPKAKGKRKAADMSNAYEPQPPQKPAPKRQKKVKDPNAPAPEKRGAIFKKKCPQNILERVDRVISQRYPFTNIMCIHPLSLFRGSI